MTLRLGSAELVASLIGALGCASTMEEPPQTHSGAGTADAETVVSQPDASPPSDDPWATASELSIDAQTCLNPGDPDIVVTRAGEDRLDISVTNLNIGTEHACAWRLTDPPTLRLLFAPCPGEKPAFRPGCFDASVSVSDLQGTNRVEIWEASPDREPAVLGSAEVPP